VSLRPFTEVIGELLHLLAFGSLHHGTAQLMLRFPSVKASISLVWADCRLFLNCAAILFAGGSVLHAPDANVIALAVVTRTAVTDHKYWATVRYII
jgi:hypothetical protein